MLVSAGVGMWEGDDGGRFPGEWGREDLRAVVRRVAVQRRPRRAEEGWMILWYHPHIIYLMTTPCCAVGDRLLVVDRLFPLDSTLPS